MPIFSRFEISSRRVPSKTLILEITSFLKRGVTTEISYISSTKNFPSDNFPTGKNTFRKNSFAAGLIRKSQNAAAMPTNAGRDPSI